METDGYWLGDSFDPARHVVTVPTHAALQHTMRHFLRAGVRFLGHASP